MVALQSAQPTILTGVASQEVVEAPAAEAANVLALYAPQSGYIPESEAIISILAKIPNAISPELDTAGKTALGDVSPALPNNNNGQVVSAIAAEAALITTLETPLESSSALPILANAHNVSKITLPTSDVLTLNERYQAPGIGKAMNLHAGKDGKHEPLDVSDALADNAEPAKQSSGNASFKPNVSVPAFQQLDVMPGTQNPGAEKLSPALDSLTLPLKTADAKGHPATEQVRFHVSNALKSGETTISVKLEPAELGRVDIRLDIARDGLVKASIMADRADTLDMLHKDSRMLERVFQDSGLKIDAGQMSFNLRGEHGNPQEANKQAGQPQDYDALNAADPAQADVEVIPAHVVYIGSGYGLIDIHV